jgi:hypothetical protein
MKDPLAAALAMIELDGVARRMVLCPPDLAPQHVPQVMADAGSDACLVDASGVPGAAAVAGVSIGVRAELSPLATARRASCATEWILLTSGTTGAPKLV